MSERRLRGSALAALLLASACAGGAAAAGGAASTGAPRDSGASPDSGAPPDSNAPPAAQPLTESLAVSLAAAHNPQLGSTLAELQRSEWEVTGEEGRYSFVLAADSGATHSASPGLSLRGVQVGSRDRLEAGVELRRHLLLGTDLALRVDGGSETSSTESIGGTTPVELGPGYDLGLRLTLRQPLLRGYGVEVNGAPLQSARARAARAGRSFDRAASTLLQEVLAAYWERWYAAEALAIQRGSLALAEQQQAEAAERARSGSLAPVEVLTFETRVASRREQLADAEALVAQRDVALAELLGQAGRQLGAPAEPEPLSPRPPAPDTAELASSASPQLLEAEAALEAARVEAIAAADPTRARLDLTAWAEARRVGNDTVPLAFGDDPAVGSGVSAHVGLIFELPLDDRLRDAARARARLAVEQASLEVTRVRQAAIAAATAQLARESASRRHVELAAATTRAAKLQLAAEQARLASGSSTAVAVLQAEDELRAARLRHARAKVDLLLASVALDELAGRLLPRYAAMVGR